MSTHINLVEKVAKVVEIISQLKIFGPVSETNLAANDPEVFVWKRLEMLGIEKDNEASHSLIADGFCKEGDARAVFCEGEPPVIAVPWFRKIWAILSDGQPASTEISGTFTGKEDLKEIAQIMAGQRPASQWSDKTIIEAYSPDCSGEIIDEFKKRADGKAIIAFENESAGTVNVDITVELLRQSRRRNTPKIYKADGKIYKLYTVGDFPSEIYEESPLAPGKLLYNGSCEICGMDFTGVSKEARQFLRVAYNEGVTPRKSDRMAMLGIVTAAKSGIAELKNIFPEVGIVYDELAKTDELPSLKSVTANQNGQSISDPFSGNQRF
jgi:hypothetical protein